MNPSIKNVDDLQSEISRLTALHQVQKTAISERFNSPSSILSTIVSLFPKPAADGIRGTGVLEQDYFGLISRFLLPFALNKTLFRHSNFIIKTLVGLVSQKASHYISEDALSNIWDKAKGLFTKLTGKKGDDKAKDLQGYGIPKVS